MNSWVDFDVDYVRRRYNKIAGFFPLFELVFLLPPGIRRKAVNRLALTPGMRVLEIGCGTGRNLAPLVRAVGAQGRVYGVDLSEGMLAKAEKLCARRGWKNVMLIRSDAAEYGLPEQVDAILFSLSYATMPHHRDVLRHAWKQLKPGGRLVIMDAKPPRGLPGKMLLPLGAWVSKKTVLGNPYLRPWDELRAVAEDVEVEEFSFGSYYICRATKN